MRIAVAAAMLAASPTFAAAIADPTGDYTSIAVAAARQPDLDVLSAQVFLNSSSFSLTSTQNGTVGTTAGGIFVWGVNRGTGVQGFPTLAPGVLFDAVAVLNSAGGSFVRLIPEAQTLPLINVSVAGATISAVVPFASLPTRGFAFDSYAFNLWPRLAGGDITNIADFAPDNSSFVATPAPGSLALLGLGALALGRMRRRQG